MAKTSTERVRDFRARQRARLEAVDGDAGPRDPDTLLLPAVETAVEALGLDGTDAAAAALAREYARTIDQARDSAYAYRWLGPLLLDCLESLGATPMARAKLKPGTPGPQRPSQLDQLRRRQ